MCEFVNKAWGDEDLESVDKAGDGREREKMWGGERPSEDALEEDWKGFFGDLGANVENSE